MNNPQSFSVYKGYSTDDGYYIAVVKDSLNEVIYEGRAKTQSLAIGNMLVWCHKQKCSDGTKFNFNLRGNFDSIL